MKVFIKKCQSFQGKATDWFINLIHFRKICSSRVGKAECLDCLTWIVSLVSWQWFWLPYQITKRVLFVRKSCRFSWRKYIYKCWDFFNAVVFDYRENWKTVDGTRIEHRSKIAGWISIWKMKSILDDQNGNGSFLGEKTGHIHQQHRNIDQTIHVSKRSITRSSCTIVI